MTSRGIDRFRLANAQRLRANATSAEQRLWANLPRIPISGTHFRRQVPIGPYVADFACMEARLIIELDGAQHGEDQQQQRDQARTAWLEKEGYRVLRFWNNEVTSNLEGVLETIYASLYGSPFAEPVLAATPPRRQRRRPSPSRAG